MQKIKIPATAKGERLSVYLAEIGIFLPLDCGGRGVCGKCKVELLSGGFSDQLGKPLASDESGCILACKAFCAGEAEIALMQSTSSAALTDFEKTDTQSDGKTGYGMALDIGTTTLACALVDLASGEVIDTLSALNPQRAFGADVMSRITASESGHLAIMQSLVAGAVRDFFDTFSKRYPSKTPTRLCVCANTVMLHIFCGESPSSMGKAPFTPVFTEKRTFAGETLGLPFDEVVLLPSASAFIGADITAGVTALGKSEAALPALLIDVGTNGEMVLFQKDGAPLAASTAAGPALEGVGISCGVGGVPGAICALSGDESGFSFKTIENAPAVGICGSGLIDAVAYLLSCEQIDESGYMEEEFTLCEGVSITPKDIRALQLAKSALRAGIETLLEEARLSPSDLAAVYVAGGLGYHMNLKSAEKIGLFPAAFLKTAKAVGNAALAGAISCLLQKEKAEAAKRFAGTCKTVDLNANPTFVEAFVEHMAF